MLCSLIFIICFTTSIILACRTLKIGKLAVSASILFYPMTFFIATLFSERYGKEKTYMMFNYAIFALLYILHGSMILAFAYIKDNYKKY